MFPPYKIDRELLTKVIQQKLTEVETLGSERVLLENPGTTAKFPVCVLYNFQARPQNSKASYALSITIEVWAREYYEAQRIYQQAADKLSEINFVEVAPTPQTKDPITKKQRYGSTFEAGWSAIKNTFYVNRS